MEQIQTYFDWNIFAHFRDYRFKGDTSKSKYARLIELIESDIIITYYSDAHLLDLIPHKGQCHNQSYTKNDLDSITCLTKNRYLWYQVIEQYWSFIEENPMHRYNELSESNTPFSYDKTLGELGFLGHFAKALILSIPLPVYDYEKHFGFAPKSVYDVMLHYNEENNKALENSSFYHERRARYFKYFDSMSYFSIHKSDSIESKLIHVIDIYLQLKRYAGQMMENRLTEVLGIFLLLDQLYITQDVKYRNMTNDAQHAFFATHSNTKILVSEDNRFRVKAIIIYMILGFNIDVMSYSEFVDYLNRY